MDLDNPFRIFPPNVWAMILTWLEDSKDIQNSFKAFPELEAVMSTTRHLWMADQAIPHLASWLSAEELLAFRQVCKPWSRAVDHFLQNHHHRRPCSPDNLLTGQRWIPEAAPEPDILFRHRFLGDSTVHNRKDVRDLLTHFCGHPPERNPFVGRSLRIAFGNWPRDEVGRVPDQFLKNYIAKIKELLRKHGRHIWFIMFEDYQGFDGRFEALLGIVVDLIRFLPNLKGLCLRSETYYSSPRVDDDGEDTGSDSSDDFDYQKLEKAPSNWGSDLLPQLETLQFLLGFHRLPLPCSILDPMIRTLASPRIRQLDK